MKFLGITITTKAVVALASTSLVHAVASASQRGNPIGDAAYKVVAAMESSVGITGAEKKATAIAAIGPVIAAELAKGGLAAVINDIEQFAGMVVEEVVGQFKQTSLLSIAVAILKALVLK